MDEERLADLLERRGIGPSTGNGLIGGGTAVRIGWDRSFDADLIEDRLTPERLEALQDGAGPTTAEEDLWREALLDSMLDAFDAPQFDLWGWHNRKGEPQIIVSWRDDAGNADAFDTIYVSIEEVRAALLRRWDRITLWCDDGWKTKASR